MYLNLCDRADNCSFRVSRKSQVFSCEDQVAPTSRANIGKSNGKLCRVQQNHNNEWKPWKGTKGLPLRCRGVTCQTGSTKWETQEKECAWHAQTDSDTHSADTGRHRHRHRHRHSHRHRHRHTDTQTHRHRHRQTQTDIDPDTDTHRQTNTDRHRETDR
eukprot:6303-Rhodomonas_salina.3